MASGCPGRGEGRAASPWEPVRGFQDAPYPGVEVWVRVRALLPGAHAFPRGRNKLAQIGGAALKTAAEKGADLSKSDHTA